MTASIPASEIVKVIPNVIGAGGSALDLSGLFLTDSGRVPAGTVASFASQAAVAAYFGALSTEATLATVYFGGFDGATQVPGAMLFAPFWTANAKAFLRGGSLAGMTLAQLQAVPSGALTLNIDGTAVTSGTINLSAASSFSNAASLIQTAIATSGVTVTFDAVTSAFVITGAKSDGTGSIAYPTTNATASGLKLTSATGAVLSQGDLADTPQTAMDTAKAANGDWATFTTTFKPSDANMQAFAAWNDAQNDRFAYMQWDLNAALTTNSDTTSAWALIKAAGYSGTVPIYDPVNPGALAAFFMGSAAAINFGTTNGRITFAFKAQSGAVQPGVTNQVIFENLKANGVNFYGGFSNGALRNWQFVYPGTVSGDYAWLDAYLDQVWLNMNLQAVLMDLLTTVNRVPYNQAGYSMIETQMLGPINDALNNGVITAGVTLSSTQALAVNTQAAVQISDTISRRGWYVQVKDPGPTVRSARGTPIINLWYTDGGAVQQITLTSTDLQ